MATASRKHLHHISKQNRNRSESPEKRTYVQKRTEYPFYLQQLPKVLEICEALSLFPRTLCPQLFPVPCLQGHGAKGLGFRVSVWENKPTLFKRTLHTHCPGSLYQQQLVFYVYHSAQTWIKLNFHGFEEPCMLLLEININISKNAIYSDSWLN